MVRMLGVVEHRASWRSAGSNADFSQCARARRRRWRSVAGLRSAISRRRNYASRSEYGVFPGSRLRHPQVYAIGMLTLLYPCSADPLTLAVISQCTLRRYLLTERHHLSILELQLSARMCSAILGCYINDEISGFPAVVCSLVSVAQRLYDSFAKDDTGKSYDYLCSSTFRPRMTSAMTWLDAKWLRFSSSRGAPSVGRTVTQPSGQPLERGTGVRSQRASFPTFASCRALSARFRQTTGECIASICC
jgi:hypothetical protein